MRKCKTAVVNDAVGVFAIHHFLGSFRRGNRQFDHLRHFRQKIRVEFGAIRSLEIEKDQALVQKR